MMSPLSLESCNCRLLVGLDNCNYTGFRAGVKSFVRAFCVCAFLTTLPGCVIPNIRIGLTYELENCNNETKENESAAQPQKFLEGSVQDAPEKSEHRTDEGRSPHLRPSSLPNNDARKVDNEDDGFDERTSCPTIGGSARSWPTRATYIRLPASAGVAVVLAGGGDERGVSGAGALPKIA